MHFYDVTLILELLTWVLHVAHCHIYATLFQNPSIKDKEMDRMQSVGGCKDCQMEEQMLQNLYASPILGSIKNKIYRLRMWNTIKASLVSVTLLYTNSKHKIFAHTFTYCSNTKDNLLTCMFDCFINVVPNTLSFHHLAQCKDCSLFKTTTA